MDPSDTPRDVSARIARESRMPYIRKLGMQDHIAYSDERIGEVASGCFQWLAVALTLPEGTKLLMFRGQMERFFRLITLDTLLYEMICLKNSGGSAVYHPILETDIASSYTTAEETIGLLRAAFGNDLHPEIIRWEDLNKRGLLIPAGYIHR